MQRANLWLTVLPLDLSYSHINTDNNQSCGIDSSTIKSSVTCERFLQLPPRFRCSDVSGGWIIPANLIQLCQQRLEPYGSSYLTGTVIATDAVVYLDAEPTCPGSTGYHELVITRCSTEHKNLKRLNIIKRSKLIQGPNDKDYESKHKEGNNLRSFDNCENGWTTSTRTFSVGDERIPSSSIADNNKSKEYVADPEQTVLNRILKGWVDERAGWAGAWERPRSTRALRSAVFGCKTCSHSELIIIRQGYCCCPDTLDTLEAGTRSAVVDFNNSQSLIDLLLNRIQQPPTITPQTICCCTSTTWNGVEVLCRNLSLKLLLLEGSSAAKATRERWCGSDRDHLIVLADQIASLEKSAWRVSFLFAKVTRVPPPLEMSHNRSRLVALSQCNSCNTEMLDGVMMIIAGATSRIPSRKTNGALFQTFLKERAAEISYPFEIAVLLLVGVTPKIPTPTSAMTQFSDCSAPAAVSNSSPRQKNSKRERLTRITAYLGQSWALSCKGDRKTRKEAHKGLDKAAWYYDLAAPSTTTVPNAPSSGTFVHVHLTGACLVVLLSFLSNILQTSTSNLRKCKYGREKRHLSRPTPTSRLRVNLAKAISE
ncbi:hypothetical protein J6590_077007 [Homalodisca vitripennis]|nr:hypothetical protein J6590_077007 [Homalodisca vitripennis]